MNAVLSADTLPETTSVVDPIVVPELRDSAATQITWIRAFRKLESIRISPPDNASLIGALDETLHDILAALPADVGRMVVCDPHDRQMLPVCSNIERQWPHFDGCDGLATWVVESGRSAIVNDARSDERCRHAPGAPRRMLATPLAIEKRIWGVVEVHERASGRLFTHADQENLERYTHAAARVLEVFLVRAGIEPSADQGSIPRRHRAAR